MVRDYDIKKKKDIQKKNRKLNNFCENRKICPNNCPVAVNCFLEVGGSTLLQRRFTLRLPPGLFKCVRHDILHRHDAHVMQFVQLCMQCWCLEIGQVHRSALFSQNCLFVDMNRIEDQWDENRCSWTAQAVLKTGLCYKLLPLCSSALRRTCGTSACPKL